MPLLKHLILIVFSFISACSPQEPARMDEADKDFFDAIKTNDIALKKPQKGEWLYAHKEPGQTFDQYVQATPIKVTAAKNTIFLKPLGQFSKEQQEMLQYTADYLTIFFQVKTQLLAVSTDSVVPATAKRIRAPFGEQLLAPYIIDSLLKDKIPAGGIAMMAISEKDLYPKEDWNYVFGLASFYNKVGVSSIKRLCENTGDSIAGTQCLFRLIQVASHEVGHMFSLHHCTNAQCTMNGSNSLPESDRQPNRLCSVCLQKIYWNVGFNNKKRLQELQDYFAKHKLWKDWRLASADVDLSGGKP